MRGPKDRDFSNVTAPRIDNSIFETHREKFAIPLALVMGPFTQCGSGLGGLLEGFPERYRA